MRTLLFLLLLGAAAASHGQTALTLRDALAMGLAARADVRVQHLAERILAERSARARSAYHPRIDGSLDGRYNVQRQTNVLPGDLSGQPGTQVPVVFGTEWNATAGIALTQRLYDPAASARMRIARLDADVQHASSAVTEDEARIAIAEAWYQVVLAQAGVDLARISFERTVQAHTEDSARAAQGTLLPIELERSTLERGGARRSLDRALRELVTAREQLGLAIGWTDPQPPAVVGDVATLLADTLGGAAPTTGALRRAEIDEARTTLLRDSAALRNERQAWLPSVDLYANLNRQYFNNVLDPFAAKRWYPWTYVGVRLNVPIWDGGDRMHRVREQRFQAEQQQIRAADLERNLALEARTQLDDYDLRRAELEDARAAFEQAQRMLDVDRVRLAQGTITQADLVRSRTDLQTRNEQLFRATYAFLRAGLLVRRNAGRW